MRNTILPIVLLLAMASAAEATESAEFERGYKAGVAGCAVQTEFWTCSLDWYDPNNAWKDSTLRAAEDGKSRADALRELAKSCRAYLSDSNRESCIEGIRSGKSVCKRL